MLLRPSALVPLLLILFLPRLRAASIAAYSDPEYLISSWDTDDGLPESSATGMAQTDDGYLWFGTFAGLVRFNGIDFRVYNKSNTPGLSGDGIVNLYLDGKARLWVSTLEGLGLRENGVWRTVSGGEGWNNDYVRTFAERPNGDVLLTGFGGGVMEFSGGGFHALPAAGVKGQGSFGAADAEGRWWSAQFGFIGRRDGSAWTPVVEPLAPLDSEVAALSARDGGVHVLTGDVLLKFQHGRETSRIRLPEAPGPTWNLMEDAQNRVWIATNGSGLWRVSPDGSFRKWDVASGLTSNTLRFAFQDREGNVWIGSNGGGLHRFTERRFHCYAPPEQNDRPNFASISSRTPEGVWLGSYGQGLFHAVAGGEVKPAELPREDAPTVIQSVLEDSAGRVWLGDYGGGIRFFKDGAVRRLPGIEKAGLNGLAFFEDSRGRVWMSGGQGVVVVEGESCRFVGVEDGLPPGAVSCFAEDSRGVIWIAHDLGVFVGKDGKFEPLTAVDGERLRGVSVFCPDPGGGAMWLGTGNRGLLRWSDGKLKAVAYSNGVPSAGIHGMIDDRGGFLWMTNRLGVARAEWRELNAVADGSRPLAHFVQLNAADGLPGTESSRGRQPLLARDSAGNLWFPFLRAAAMIDPARFALRTEPPAVHLEKVRYLHSDARGGEEEIEILSPFPAVVTLPAGSRRLEFVSAGLDFGAPDKVKYEVKLDGRDPGWRDAGQERGTAIYELPPGRYVFRARAANRDGVWNETGAALTFEIGAFYWQRLWFRAAGAGFLVCLGAVAVWGFTRMRHNRMRERLANQEQRAELAHLSRVAMLSELSGSLAHELNQPLAIILSNAQAAQKILGGEPGDIGEVREILADIVSENRRAGDVIHRLRALLKRGESSFSPECLNQLVTESLSLTKQELLNRGIAVECDLGAGLPAVKADRIQLQQVVINLITNACDSMAGVPPEERRLRLVTAEKKGQVRLSVIDRGCGLPQGDPEALFKPFFTTKPQGLGLGLCICRSIMQAHGGTLKAERDSPRGAVFVLTLPVGAIDTTAHDAQVHSSPA